MEDTGSMPQPAIVSSPAAAVWPEQGSWTWEHYLRLPEDENRYEIIQGVLYVSPAPIYLHQFVIASLLRLLSNFVYARQLGVVLTAPFDVILPGIAQPVQPDILFLRSGNQPADDAKNFKGVPDLIVEVLSKGTSRLDQHVKFEAYERAGVAEFWLVDPKLKAVTIFGLGKDGGEYRELGRFGVSESVRSEVLEGFEARVEELFPRKAAPSEV